MNRVMWSTWMQPEDPPWKPELFAFFIRSRLPGTAGLALAILLTVDTGAALPWLLGLLGIVALVNIVNYRWLTEARDIPPAMGFLDIVSPMFLTWWIPSLLYPALMISIMAAILARLAYGPRITAAGVATVAVWASVQTIIAPVPAAWVSIAVYLVTTSRAVIGLGVLTRREMRVAARLSDLVAKDALTGLANRVTLLDDLATRIDRARAGEGAVRVGLLYLDLDRFKEVNDGLGHHHGDLLLIDVARRLALAAPGATVARMGGDEFAIAVDEHDEGESVDLAARIHAALAEPVDIGDLCLSVGASIGIAVAPDHGDCAVDLVKRADIAMYEAKAQRGATAVYRAGTDDAPTSRLQIVDGLRSAVAEDQLCLAYQPLIGLDDGAVHGLEALVRWEHPERGLLQPADFIELAEITGVIGDITAWVLGRAIADAVVWRALGHDVGVSVNLSMVDFDRGDLVDLVARVLQDSGLEPSALTLELTETATIGDHERVGRILSDLAALGVRLSIDDFGAGFTSLTYLRSMPVDEVKIDRAFVDALEDPTTAEIVGAVVGLGARLGLDVVAEGVNDPAVAARLRGLGCRFAQGFALGRPVPLSAVRFAPVPHLVGLVDTAVLGCGRSVAVEPLA